MNLTGYLRSNGGSMSLQYRDIDGRPTERTPSTHPYSYDPYVIGQWGDAKTASNSAYDDRMEQQDYDKFRYAKERVFGKHGGYFSGMGDHAKASAFLTAYYGKPCEAVAVLQGANHATGYPYLFIYWNEPSATPKKAETE